ncbi:makorin, ring finger protein, 1 [Plakobranchus ocellatus]|uniref:RING-type E3 ubiquitin transferase n=1 Tax=Plakobranchus ocellatus TaxID=259542 RepID=A0AAV3XMB8_9GAST|nr:makorin, ring finger protein, 1 [Plakobranchus ocellatus]
MAEGGVRPRDDNQAKINVVCKYFIHGVCSKGPNCKFVHDKSRTLPMDNICKYYQYGNCFYGENCRYDHVKRDRTLSSDHQEITSSKPNGRFRASSDTKQSMMVTLTKGGIEHSIKEAERKKEREEKWAQAKAFVPGQKYHAKEPTSYAAAIVGNQCNGSDAGLFSAFGYDLERNGCDETGINCYSVSMTRTGIGGLPTSAIKEDTPLCPYYMVGECPYDDQCTYAHGDICDMCGMPQLHPANKEQRIEHEKKCVEEHEKEMEKAFAIQASQSQECGICLENVLDKECSAGSIADRRFGILENCNHCFCLTCIRQWRGNKEISIETHRSCPTCRTHSDFITPSKYWVTTSEEKTKLIQDYKKALKAKPCQYFKKGKGECPFNRKCFYRHALEDGTEVEANLIQRRRRTNADGEYAASDEDLSLWDFIQSRDSEGLNLDMDDFSLLLMEMFQPSDDERDSSGNNSYDFYDWDSDDSDAY